jgi:hypothetical protein
MFDIFINEPRGRVLRLVPQFDIFSGKFGKGAIWLEAVAELRSAETKMKLFAADNPGHYFVYRHETHRVVASINTAEGRWR